MTNLLERMKTYNFWISLVSAIILVLRIIGDKFNFFVDATLIMDITTGLCGIFVVLGIISAPSGKKEEIVKMNEIENEQAIGRFEQIAAMSNAAEIDTCENLDAAACESETEEVVSAVSDEDKVIGSEEFVKTEENENQNVENIIEFEEKIQPQVDLLVDEPKAVESEDKKEIAELLKVLITKIENL